MASPITHIALALKILCFLPDTIDRQAFIVGTSFPDIRHMAGLSRQATHVDPVCWNDVITEPSSFRAGMLLHNLVDELRIAHFEPYFYDRFYGIYDSDYATYFPLVMKFAEDAILYPYVASLKEVCSCFDTIYPQELGVCPDKIIVCYWHQLIKNYCLQAPTLDTIELFLSGVGKRTIKNAPESCNYILYFNQLVENQLFKKRLLDFYDSFEALLGINNELTAANTAYITVPA